MKVEIVLCWPWGVPAVLVLGLGEDGGVRAAAWRWREGTLRMVRIARA